MYLYSIIVISCCLWIRTTASSCGSLGVTAGEMEFKDVVPEKLNFGDEKKQEMTLSWYNNGLNQIVDEYIVSVSRDGGNNFFYFQNVSSGSDEETSITLTLHKMNICTVPNDFMCCKAQTADCLACVAGISTEKFCKMNPETAGCPVKGRNCCLALTSECLACADGVSEEEYCKKNPDTMGCEYVETGLVSVQFELRAPYEILGCEYMTRSKIIQVDCNGKTQNSDSETSSVPIEYVIGGVVGAGVGIALIGLAVMKLRKKHYGVQDIDGTENVSKTEEKKLLEEPNADLDLSLTVGDDATMQQSEKKDSVAESELVNIEIKQQDEGEADIENVNALNDD